MGQLAMADDIIRIESTNILSLLQQAIRKKLEIIFPIYSFLTFPIITIQSKIKGCKKKILLDCPTANFADYIAQVTDLLNNDSRIQFYLLTFRRKDRPDGEEYISKFLPYKKINRLWAYLIKWNLIITACANSNKPLITKFRCPSLKIEHGIESGKIMDGKLMVLGSNLFDCIFKNNIRFTKIFSSSSFNKERAIKYHPELLDIMTVVGFLDSDRLIETRIHKNSIRSNLGLNSDKKIVFVLSSWGPNCLFNLIGMPFLKEAKKLMSEYIFILNVHPLEHRRKPKGRIVWGDFIKTQKKFGFIVREPSQDWVPYMVACDVLISDYTSLCLNGSQIGLNTIFAPFPDHCTKRGSLIWELRQISPVLNETASNLKEKLNEALNNTQMEKLKDLSKKINSYPGEAKTRYKEEIYKVLDLK